MQSEGKRKGITPRLSRRRIGFFVFLLKVQMRAALSLSAVSARRLYVGRVSRSLFAGLTGSRSSVAAARTTERRRMSPPPLRPPTTAPLTTTAAAAAAASTSTSSPAAFSLYSHPRLYDAAFAFRDFEAEAQFLVDAWEAYGGGGEGGEGSKETLSSFLDIGCGPGKHGAALSRLLLSDPGSNGPPRPLSLFALDSSAEMLAAASAAASEAGCPLERAIRTDMTAGGSFNIEGFGSIDGRVQVALCALGTLAHALPPADSSSSSSDPALNVLRAACAALVPGGLLVLELPAAGDLFDGTLLAGDAWDVPAGAWRRGEGGSGAGEESGKNEGQPAEPEKRRIGQIVPPKNKLKNPTSSSSPALIVEYGSPDDAFDPVAQVLFRTVVVSEAKGDGSAGREVGRETVAQRLFSPGEVRALAREAGFAVAAELGDMDLRGGGDEEGGGEDPPLSAQEGDRYVAVLVKKS